MEAFAKEQSCRTCGEQGRFVNLTRKRGRFWIRLPCGHWQAVPGAMEVVMWDPKRDCEVWGSLFDPGVERVVPRR